MLDQIIVSKGMFLPNGLHTYYTASHIFDAEWLMYQDKKYNGIKPNRTYVGPRYTGGYSDHLPVYIDILK